MYGEMCFSFIRSKLIFNNSPVIKKNFTAHFTWSDLAYRLLDEIVGTFIFQSKHKKAHK